MSGRRHLFICSLIFIAIGKNFPHFSRIIIESFNNIESTSGNTLTENLVANSLLNLIIDISNFTGKYMLILGFIILGLSLYKIFIKTFEEKIEEKYYNMNEYNGQNSTEIKRRKINLNKKEENKIINKQYKNEQNIEKNEEIEDKFKEVILSEGMGLKYIRDPLDTKQFDLEYQAIKKIFSILI